MKGFRRQFTVLLAALSILVPSRNSCEGAITKLEAEAADLGAHYVATNFGGVDFITITSNTTGESPGDTNRIATFQVTFPAAGTYDFYARVRVGNNGANDDSFFYGNGFGAKPPVDAVQWIRVNSLNVAGYANASDQVVGSGSAGVAVWKWLNLSEFSNGSSEAGLTFTVAEGSLTQTFQIGAREDGFDIDAIAFGTATYTFTVANLDAGTDGTPPGIGMCTVNWNQIHQRIDGFGASSAWRSTWNTTLADRFFSTNTGLGLSLLRTRIAPGGTTVEQSIMQMAQGRGARVWSAPWSPAPASQFKNNGSVNGGSFIGNASNYQAYASQLAGYVVNMKNQYGLNLYAISVQNEPDANVTTYESCRWTAQQIHDFIPYLSSALATNGVGATKIVLPESQNWTDPQGLRLIAMNDPSVAALVGIIANHNYVPDNLNGDQTAPAAINNYGKALWETEVSTFDAFDGSMDNAIYWAKRLHAFLTLAQVNAWHYWWLASGGDNNEGLAGPGDVMAKRGYVVGQYSRFVRPDFYRIGVITNFGTALVSAYKEPPSAKFAIVAVNPGALTLNQTFNLSGFGSVASVAPWITSSGFSLAGQSSVTVSNSSFTYNLPAMSVVTFVGQAVSNVPPTLAPIANQIINPGANLTLTNLATDPDAPPQVLSFSALSAPSNAVLDSMSGILSWRPLVGQADTTNDFAIRVTDSGSPSLSATNTFTVTVNPLIPPELTAASAGNGQLTLTATGTTGPDYSLLTSTNLADWQLVFTTNSPELPASFVISNTLEARRFFLLQAGP